MVVPRRCMLMSRPTEPEAKISDYIFPGAEGEMRRRPYGGKAPWIFDEELRLCTGGLHVFSRKNVYSIILKTILFENRWQN